MYRSSRNVFVSAAVCVVVPSAACAAGPVLIGELLTLDDADVFNVGGVSVAFNTVDDEYRVAWFDSRIEGQNDVYAQRVGADGSILGDDVEIIAGPASATDSSIAHDPVNNRYLITWRNQSGPPGSPGFNHAFGAIASADGGLITSPDDLSSGGLEATLAYNAVDGEFFLEARNFAGGGTAGIRGRRIGADGAPIGNDLIISSVGAPAPAGQVVYNADANQYLATWRNQTAEDLEGRIVNADGTFETGAFPISDTFPSSGLAASAAYDPVNDRYLVIFAQFSGGPIFGRFVQPDGTTPEDQFTILDSAANLSPFLTYDPVNQAYLLAWVDFTDGSVSVLLLDDAGNQLGEALPLNNPGFANGPPRIAANANDGGFLVAFRDSGSLAAGGGANVLGQLVGIATECVGDLDASGDVNVFDLLALLDAWGDCPGCDADLNGDDVVNVFDLLHLLEAWGDCP
jgi:hypothetical protein